MEALVSDRGSTAAPAIAVGIDVGGPKKGFHAVALRDGSYHARLSTRKAHEIVAWCCKIGARAIGVDAPCRWSATGRARPAERQLMGRGISCFATPTRQRASAHPKNHYGWMLNGAELFSLLEPGYPLFAGGPVSDTAPICFETFPHAIACALAGCPVSARAKATARRVLLRTAGIETEHLSNIDHVDAALCALAAHRLLQGTVRAYGEAETGLIVVPFDGEMAERVRGSEPVLRRETPH